MRRRKALISEVRILDRSIFVAEAAWRKDPHGLMRALLPNFQQYLYKREGLRIIGEIEYASAYASADPKAEHAKPRNREVKLWARGYKVPKRFRNLDRQHLDIHS